jgi:lipopolysaccharide transport system ATP-binding protein
MKTSPHLRLDSVSKRYFIRAPRFTSRAVRAAMASWLYETKKELWALQDISLDLEPGKMLGVIGLNGSGKSTLLKLVAGVTGPTSGRIDKQGSLVGLLELGAGFHPDLTGYQNIYLQGNLLGLSKPAIKERLERIVEFSGIGPFLEWPIKRYSSGMHARLGFSLALHVDAKIILIDEILAVGDAEFQKRGLARIREIRKKGDTIIVLVTHDVTLVRDFCDEALWLEKGRIRKSGKAHEIATEYTGAATFASMNLLGLGSDLAVIQRAKSKRAENSPLRIKSVSFRDDQGRKASQFDDLQPATVSIEVESVRPLAGIDLTVFLVREDNAVMAEIQSSDRTEAINVPRGSSEIAVRLDPQMLLEGVFSASVLIAENETREVYFDIAERQGNFTVVNRPPRPRGHSVHHPHTWSIVPE